MDSSQNERSSVLSRYFSEIRGYPLLTFDEAMLYAGDVSANLFSSSEGKEGMAAFLEKRPPSWSPQSGRS